MEVGAAHYDLVGCNIDFIADAILAAAVPDSAKYQCVQHSNVDFRASRDGLAAVKPEPGLRDFNQSCTHQVRLRRIGKANFSRCVTVKTDFVRLSEEG